MIGTKLAHFHITAHLGSGGMGDVYQATDSKLGRSVAIKLLPEAFARDSERVARFEREARVLASLNHPNIAVIYGLERVDGRMFLVMEYVPGETLAERIKKGPIPADDALGLGKQICEGLEAAHDKGVVHRDLKPANVKVTPEGRVKILDFGLAKAYAPQSSDAVDPANSPTLMSTPSTPGAIMGTAAYMSPEQAKGKEVDKRTDIFAFGCVLYEMLTGKRAFDGEDIADTLGAVLKSEPDWNRLPSEVSPSMQTLLRLCLEKNARNRRSDASDVRIDLEHLQQEPALEAARPVQAKVSARAGWIAAFLFALAFVAVGFAYFSEKAPVTREMRLDIATPASTGALQFALSPDGQSIAFVAYSDGATKLWLRRLDQPNAQAFAGTDSAQYPFWSPDSKSVGFVADGKLKRIDAANGGIVTLTDAIPTGCTWSTDGSILFHRVSSAGGTFQRISAAGGKVTDLPVFQNGFTLARFPEFVSDGRHFLLYVIGAPDVQGIYLGSLDGAAIKRLGPADSAAHWLPPDRVLYVQQGRLVSRRLDLNRGELIGDAETIAEHVGVDVLFEGGFSASAEGLLAYRGGEQAPSFQLKWLDRSGKTQGKALNIDASGVSALEISPDQKRLALDRYVQGNRDVWLADLLRGNFTRLTFDPTLDGYPIWFPDGTRIAFESARTGDYHIYTKASNGAGEDQLLFKTPGSQWPEDISRDGKFLLYYDTANSGDLLAWPLAGADHKPIPVATTGFSERTGAFSPDGRWVAYETNESDRFEVVVQAFPKPEGKWQISTDGGIYPRWSADGKELYFLGPENKLMSAVIHATATSPEASPPVALFSERFANTPAGIFRPQYAVARDGHFLVNEAIEPTNNIPITLILNWKPKAQK